MSVQQKYENANFQNHQETKAIRGGYIPGPDLSHSEPLHCTSSYHYKGSEHAVRLYTLQEAGNIYTRLQNPTTDIFEKRMALLEGTEAGLATASGMAAINLTLTQLLQAGDHVVCANEIYGGTSQLLSVTLKKFGIETTFVSLANSEEWEAAVQDNTKVFIFETPANPVLMIGDIEALVTIAKKHNITTVIDNTIATPVLQQPLKYGVDIIVHSATKYIDGQGRAIGGVVCGSQAFIDGLRTVSLRNTGPCLSPFDAWIFLKSLETLAIRMEAHSKNALKIAQFLENHPKVKKVNYPFLESFPQYELAKKQQKHGGGLLSFEVDTVEQGAKIINSVELISLVGNLGDAKTIIGHPASTSHQQLSEEDRSKAGIAPGLLRLSVGLENAEDLIADLENVLEQI